MDKTALKICCPRCGFKVTAELDGIFRKFVLYSCPQCTSNVVFYKNKIDVISNRLVKSLIERKILTVCGNTLYTQSAKKRQSITRDDLLNLKILLETEEDFDRIVAKL